MKTTSQLLKMKEQQQKIVMVTAYDYPSAKFSEAAEVDMILVGDSVGMVVLGYESTMQVTVEDMIHHGKAARRGAPNTFIVVDMPFGSYHSSLHETVKTAVHMMQQTNANALKVEGAGEVIDVIAKLTSIGIPVVAHLGLQPQHAGVLGGYKVQGKTVEQAEQLVADAKAAQAAGACAIVFECIPHQLMAYIAKQVAIPTIGIGAGKEADGQVLVYHDLLVYGTHRLPKFVQSFAQVGEQVAAGLQGYVQAVRNEVFPSEAHQFTMDEEQVTALYGGTAACK